MSVPSPSLRLGAALVGGLLTGSTIQSLFLRHQRRLARDREVVEAAPLFTSVGALREFILNNGAPGGAGPRAATVSLEAIAATTNGGDIVVQEEQVEEIEEHYTYIPEIVEETEEHAQEAASASTAGTTTTTRRRQRQAARWQRSEETRVVTAYAANREMHTLLLTDRGGAEAIAINATSLQQVLQNSPDIWTTRREWYESLNDRATPPHISASVNLNLNLSFTSGSASSSAAVALPPPIPPRVLGRRHRQRSIRAGDPIYAYGLATLEESVGEGQLAAEMTLTPTVLRSGTRTAYLTSFDDNQKESRILGWVCAGISAVGAFALMASNWPISMRS